MIRLNKQQKEYLLLKLKGIAATDFLGKAIIEEIDKDDMRISVMDNCEHTPQEYIGHKNSCSKCGDFLIEDGVESWTAKS